MQRFVSGCKDARLVYLSSDAIFSGKRGLYSERDRPDPATSYGRNLLHFETEIARICTDHCIIRPSYLYGFSNGQLDARLHKARTALRKGERLSLFTDTFKSPLGVAQVADAVAGLGLADVRGVVHVAGERLSVFDFYRRGLTALGVSTKGLAGETMPGGMDLPRDTSLDTSLWQQLMDTKPLSIEETLRD